MCSLELSLLLLSPYSPILLYQIIMNSIYFIYTRYQKVVHHIHIFSWCYIQFMVFLCTKNSVSTRREKLSQLCTKIAKKYCAKKPYIQVLNISVVFYHGQKLYHH
jgi:hypothetical protein